MMTKLFAIITASFVTVLPIDEFERLHRELPPENETWKTIPWKLTLLEARKIAAAQQKPMFIWAMDGHPLGCT